MRTGRGGYHVYYFWDKKEPPPPRVIKARKLPVDLLANGFAVIPPSSSYRDPKGGGPYQWVKRHSPHDVPVAELEPLPDALLEWWHQVSTEPALGAAKGVPLQGTSATKGSGAWRLITETIPEGSRNDTLTRIAGWLHLYHPTEQVTALLIAINESRCMPPLDLKEVQAIARSIAKYPQPGVIGHPRAAVPHYVRQELDNG